MIPFTSDVSSHVDRLSLVEASREPIVGFVGRYRAGEFVAPHSHGRAQLLHTLAGVVMVSTSLGRWLVPPDHAMWIPAGTVHAVEMVSEVTMRSAYLLPEAAGTVPPGLAVLEMTELMRALLSVCVEPPKSGQRRRLALALLGEEVGRMRVLPLGLPLPHDERLARLCRDHLTRPSSSVGIDGWASALGMSRRSFTRHFQRQTGVSLGLWRQQACLFAALPRLADGESVTRVALDLGYDSVPAFTTMFSRMLGAPPRAYLRAAS